MWRLSHILLTNLNFGGIIYFYLGEDDEVKTDRTQT